MSDELVECEIRKTEWYPVYTYDTEDITDWLRKHCPDQIHKVPRFVLDEYDKVADDFNRVQRLLKKYADE